MPLPAFQLAYYFPPIPSVGVRRNEAMARLLVERGHALTLVTSEHTPESTYDFDVDVRRVPLVDYRSRRGRPADFAPAASAKSGRLYEAFGKLSNSFPSNLLVGEGGPAYIVNAYRLLVPLVERAGGRGILYSSFRPWADLQVAYLLKRRFPSLHWWCDWRDTPFEHRYGHYLHLPFQQAVLRRLLSRTDFNSAVSAGILDDLELGSDRGMVVYNGASLPPQPVSDSGVGLSPKLVYTGSLYGPHRDPRPLLQALAVLREDLQAEAITVCYAGKDVVLWNQYCTESGVNVFGESLGLLSADAAINLQQSALANILLTWANPGQTGGLTMKLFEYLQAGRPIIRIHDGPPDGELDTLLAQASAPTMTHYVGVSDIGELVAFLRRLLSDQEAYATQPGWDLSGRLAAAYDAHFSPSYSRG